MRNNLQSDVYSFTRITRCLPCYSVVKIEVKLNEILLYQTCRKKVTL